MDERRLRLMKPDAILLNAGRGSVLDQEDKTFVALYAHAVEFFEKLLDTFNKHPFEIGFIHSLQCYFAASDYKNMFIIHLSDHLYY